MSSASYEPAPRETGPNRNGNPLAQTPDMTAQAALKEKGFDATSPGDAAPEGDAPESEIARFKKIALSNAKQAERNHEATFARRAGGWQRAYRAYRNEHFMRSKYLTREYESRSKLFVPKTRSALRNKQTGAAAALFSNEDFVTIQPEREDDDAQQASAIALHEVLNYRLDRTSPKGGIPWFQIAMGAHQDALFAGICVSKQDWEFEERQVGTEPVKEPMIDPTTGQPFMDPTTGEPVMAETGKTQPVMKTIKDRPMIMPIPPENVIIDPAAPWYEPAQGAGYLTLRFPMQLGAVKKMIAGGNNPKSRVKWIKVDEAALKRACAAYDAKGIRMAREGGTDRLDERSRTINDFSIVWVHETFERFENCDYHYYSVGSVEFLSEIAETEEIYPALKGSRPVVYGYGALESHNLSPMSPVESWQPLQQEINDGRNLRLDAAKQSVLPFATVKAGKQVDVSVLQKLAPGAHIYVKDHEDIQFRELPNGIAGTVVEGEHLNVDFDDLSGSFSPSSVSTNRSLNETVGGMRILSGNASSLTEFDLKVFAETWVEPTIRQFVHLIQFYENDETVLAVAGARGGLAQKFGIDAITDDMLARDVTVRVNIGVGATDPMHRLQQFQMGMEMVGKAVPFMKGLVRLKPEPLIKEIMAGIGRKSGMRFFEVDEEQPSMSMMQMQMKVDLEKMKNAMHVRIAEERSHSIRDVERMRGAVALIDTIINAKLESDQLRQQGAQDATGMLGDYFNRSETQIPVGDPSDAQTYGADSGQQGQGGPPGAGGPQPGGDASSLLASLFGGDASGPLAGIGAPPSPPMGPDGAPTAGSGAPMPPMLPAPPPDPAMVKVQTANDLAQQKFEHEKAMAEKKHQLAVDGQNRDFALKSAAHNKQMVDEATQTATNQDVQAMRPASGLENLTATVTALAQVVAQGQQTMTQVQTEIAQGQAQQAQEVSQLVSAIAEGQARQADEFRNLAAVMAAPKHIELVRGRDGKATGANVSPT